LIGLRSFLSSLLLCACDLLRWIKVFSGLS
jgi:hypothetical protein